MWHVLVLVELLLSFGVMLHGIDCCLLATILRIDPDQTVWHVLVLNSWTGCLQDVVRVLGLPAGVTIGAFDALAAYNSPNATLAALGRAVFTVEASLTNIVALGVWLLDQYSDDYNQLGVLMYTVRSPRPARSAPL